jgi:hypothetical protein
MVATPPLTPVTTPAAFTEAIAPLPDNHVPAAGVAVSVVVVPADSVAVPVITAATGSAFTVTTLLAVALPQMLVTL